MDDFQEPAERPSVISREYVIGLLRRVFEGRLPDDLLSPLLDHLEASGVVVRDGASFSIARCPAALAAFPSDAERSLYNAIADHARVSKHTSILLYVMPLKGVGGSGSGYGLSTATTSTSTPSSHHQKEIERMKWERRDYLRAFAGMGEQAAARLFDHIVESMSGRRSVSSINVADANRFHLTPDSRPAFIPESNGLWSVRFAGKVATLRHRKGLLYIHQLLARPNDPIHTWTLLHGSDPVPETIDPVVDGETIRNLRRQVDELKAAQAEETDLNKRVGQEAEIAKIQQYLTRCQTGFGKERRARRARGACDKAREVVGKAIASALRRIAEDHPELHCHLDEAIVDRSGMTPCYRPRGKPPHWLLEGGGSSGSGSLREV
jgi:hypothetical protein